MPRRPTALVLAMDIGSSSLRTALFTERGARLVATTAARQYALKYTADGGAELDAAVLLRAAKACLRETLNDCDAPVIAVAGCGFWHGLLGLNASGKPATPILTWADNRSVTEAVALRKEFREREIQSRTGCMLRAPFWPAKLLWFRRTNPKSFRRIANWTSPAAWIFGQLFGTPGSSHSMASGTGLYNLNERTWDAELCQHCDVDRAQLDQLGDAPRAATKALRNAKIFAVIGDSAASNLGCGADSIGRVAINIGTSAAVRMIVPRKRKLTRGLPSGLFAYVVDDDRLVLGGAVSNAGNLRAWCLRELRIDGDVERTLSREYSATDNLTILPYLVRERAPSWPENVPATITGFAAATDAADIFRAATTATYYRLAEIFDALAPALPRVDEVIVSGGVLKSPASLRILADCVGRDIRMSAELESSLRGAAIHTLDRLGYKVDPLPVGRIVRHRPALAKKHHERRERQAGLERLLS
jgi:gluconokinase